MPASREAGNSDRSPSIPASRTSIDLVTSEIPINGVALIPLKIIRDDRGAVMHMLRADAPHFQSFGEIYFSLVNPKVVKAWKRHHRMTLNLAVVVGSIKLAIYDDRPDSPTRGATQEIIFGPENYTLVTVPPGVWYGFSCHGDSPALMANCATTPHDPTESDSLPANSESIPYRW